MNHVCGEPMKFPYGDGNVSNAKNNRDWLLIRTAPKDGSEVVCWCPCEGVRTLRWTRISSSIGLKRSRGTFFGWTLANFPEHGVYRPTHYLMLEPPTANQKRSGAS